MRKSILALLVGMALLPSYAAVSARAAPVPCEDTQKQLETALLTKQLAGADKAEFNELKAKGMSVANLRTFVERDNSYTQPLVVLGQQAAIVLQGTCQHPAVTLASRVHHRFWKK